jgi:hypothetical protein
MGNQGPQKLTYKKRLRRQECLVSLALSGARTQGRPHRCRSPEKGEPWKTTWSKCCLGYSLKQRKKSWRRQRLRPCIPCSLPKIRGRSTPGNNRQETIHSLTSGVRRNLRLACAYKQPDQRIPSLCRSEQPANPSCGPSSLKNPGTIGGCIPRVGRISLSVGVSRPPAAVPRDR